MSDATRAFRDYATRVSFNMSLLRNQVGHLFDERKKLDDLMRPRTTPFPGGSKIIYDSNPT